MKIRPIVLLLLISASTLLVLVACNNSPNSLEHNSDLTSSSCEIPSKFSTTSNMSLTITNEDLTLTDIVQTNPELVENTQQTIDYLQGDWDAWVLAFYIEPDLPFETDYFVMNPVRVDAQSDLTGTIILRNEYALPHNARLMVLLDYQSIPLEVENEIVQYLNVPEIEPHEDYIVEFSMGGLETGFHQLSALVITDPLSNSSDKEYRIAQQHSFQEQRVDLWVGSETLPSDIPFYDDPEEGTSASFIGGRVEVIAIPETTENEPLVNLEMLANETACIPLRFFNCGENCSAEQKRSFEDLPQKLLVMWDDQVTQEYDFTLSSDMPDNFTLNLQVEAPSGPGSHQLGIVVFSLPGYSQATPDRDYTLTPRALFSRRILVEVLGD
jgi:hypothetical protein